MNSGRKQQHGLPRLYGTARSSATFRVRIGLNLKGVEYASALVDLQAREHQSKAYRTINPQGLVPVLVIDGHVLSQSLAILEYLEEVHPDPPILPAQAAARAHVRALAQIVACDIHPLNNPRVLEQLSITLGASEAEQLAWYRPWIADGLMALARAVGMLASPTSGVCYGDTITLADVCLVPQLINARRFECPLEAYPTLMRIFDRCMRHPAFRRAQPAWQADFK